jgi:hypothetical protein
MHALCSPAPERHGTARSEGGRPHQATLPQASDQRQGLQPNAGAPPRAHGLCVRWRAGVSFVRLPRAAGQPRGDSVVAAAARDVAYVGRGLPGQEHETRSAAVAESLSRVRGTAGGEFAPPVGPNPVCGAWDGPAEARGPAARVAGDLARRR